MGFVDLLYPRMCLGCGVREAYLCRRCGLNYVVAGKVCPKCKRSSFGGVVHGGCRGKYIADGMISVWRYSGVIKKTISYMKFKFGSQLCEDIVEIGVGFLDKGDKKLLRSCKLVAMPTHKKRVRWRGFDHIAYLSEKLSKNLGLEVLDVIERVEFRSPQVGLSKSERIENVKNAFKLKRADLVYGQKIVVFDDVYTSGATVGEVVSLLKTAGARNVWIFTLAR